VALRRRTGDDGELAGRPSAGAAWADALERYVAMSVPSPEQHRTLHDLQVTLSEAFQALVLARLLIPYIYQGGGVGGTLYAVSGDGRAALERGDVAEVVARRLPA
jgi:hypothetical protein